MKYRDPLLEEMERHERRTRVTRRAWGVVGVVALVAALLAWWSGPKKRPPVVEQVPVEIVIDEVP